MSAAGEGGRAKVGFAIASALRIAPCLEAGAPNVVRQEGGSSDGCRCWHHVGLGGGYGGGGPHGGAITGVRLSG